MTAQHLQFTLNKINETKTIDYTKVPSALEKKDSNVILMQDYC